MRMWGKLWGLRGVYRGEKINAGQMMTSITFGKEVAFKAAKHAIIELLGYGDSIDISTLRAKGKPVENYQTPGWWSSAYSASLVFSRVT